MNALVRITWLYTVVPGEGLVTYDVGDYVQDGLVWNYDGIRNAGANADHDPSATTWVNLGSAGSAYDLSLQRLNYLGSDLVNVGADGMSGGWNPGAWTENG